MIISDFTNLELSYFRTECNFTPKELDVFELRGKGESLNDIAEILDITVNTVKKISQKVNKKILKVL